MFLGHDVLGQTILCWTDFKLAVAYHESVSFILLCRKHLLGMPQNNLSPSFSYLQIAPFVM